MFSLSFSLIVTYPLFIALQACRGQVASSEWETAYSKARTAVAKLTLNDKVSLTTGVGTMLGPCVGNTPSISTINFPGLCLEDSPLGVRGTDKVSVFPAGINVAATFNKTLMRARGSAMGAEFRGKGIQVQLGPMMNLMRAPASGRAWEGFGGDPYLSGEGAYETIMGIQSQGVQAVAKHIINNEQEHSRDASSSNVDDRTQHEVYLHPFLRSVQANVASVMCSYNQINGTFACQNNNTLNGLLKTELAFQGYIMSDWSATHSTDAANQGLDMTMPGAPLGLSPFGSNLVTAVSQSQITNVRIDDMATRILAAWYLLGQDSGYPAVNFDTRDPLGVFHPPVDVQGDHKTLIRTIGATSTVLLKNIGNALPLRKPHSIAIVGSGAGSNFWGPNSCFLHACNTGVLAEGWGSGTADFPYLIAPVDAISTRATSEGSEVSSSLSDSDLDAAVQTVTGKSVAFVFVTADSGELGTPVDGNDGDRNDLQAWYDGDALINAVAAVNPNTVVVVNTVGPIIVEAWIDNPNVTALVWSGLPGQEAGNSLVDILYGDYNPSGRLPYTVGKSIDDYCAKIDYTSSANIVQINYTEGLFIDYRHFDAANITPRYEFGFGLSYTTFSYSSLSVSGSAAGGTPRSGYGSSLDLELHTKVIAVTFTLKNTGAIGGHEIPQLYVSLPSSANSPPSQLKGFDSVYLAAGESRQVSFHLSRYDVSIWDVVTQRWEVPSGAIGVMVGPSSRQLLLKGTIPSPT